MLDLPAIAKHLPPDLFKPAPVEIQQIQRDNIRIEFRYQEFESEGNTGRFHGNVRAFYGPTILECEELFVDYDRKIGRAKGKVRITDPEGVLEAEDLEFNWVQQTGVANNVKVNAAGVKMQITSLEIGPKQWIATEFKGTPSKTKPPEFEFAAQKLFLRPGKSGRAVKPKLVLFGAKVLELPSYTFSLDKRVVGFRPPSIGYRNGSGFGLTWTSEFLINDQTSIATRLNAFPRRFPSFETEITFSPLSSEKSSTRLNTRSDLGDRFADSWFDSILVDSPESEFALLSAPRQLFSMGTYWSQATRGRREDGTGISKPVDFAYEYGGQSGRWVGLSQIRAQQVKGGRSEPTVERGALQLILRREPLPLARSLALVFGIDGHANLDRSSKAGEVRGSAFLLAKPSSYVTLGVGGVAGFDFGRARYSWDRNQVQRAFHTRADFDLGNIQLGALVKYDTDQRRWYDVEYGVSFIAGSFEPYFLYRQSPREVRFGVRLRLDEFVELISRKDFRQREPAQTKSGAGTKPAP